MKYSLNYYSKKSPEFKDIHKQKPGILESFTNSENKRTTEGFENKELSRFQFVVPWQLH